MTKYAKSQRAHGRGGAQVGECSDYVGDNAYRSTKAELKERERLESTAYEEAREGAEVHRTARKYLQSIAKPGEKARPPRAPPLRDETRVCGIARTLERPTAE